MGSFPNLSILKWLPVLELNQYKGVKHSFYTHRISCWYLKVELLLPNLWWMYHRFIDRVFFKIISSGITSLKIYCCLYSNNLEVFVFSNVKFLVLITKHTDWNELEIFLKILFDLFIKIFWRLRRYCSYQIIKYVIKDFISFWVDFYIHCIKNDLFRFQTNV